MQFIRNNHIITCRCIVSIISSIMLFLVLVPGIAGAEKKQSTFEEKYFLEMWGDNSYRRTEFGWEEPGYEEKDYYISYISLTTGLRFDLNEEFYLDPLFIVELSGDWGGEEWNDVYWSNMLLWGVGARFGYDNSPDYEEEPLVMVSDFNAELFVNMLFSEDSPDGGKDGIPDADATNNFLAGISVWTSLDSREFFSGVMNLWAEIGADLTYESTGFAEDSMDDYYLFSIESLFGPQFPIGDISLQPYYSVDVIRDLGDEQWNKEPWLNNVTYGPGFRLSMGELLPFEEADLYLYAEYVQIDYFSRVDAESYEFIADDDFRAGVEIYLPFGSTKDRLNRH